MIALARTVRGLYHGKWHKGDQALNLLGAPLACPFSFILSFRLLLFKLGAYPVWSATPHSIAATT